MSETNRPIGGAIPSFSQHTAARQRAAASDAMMGRTQGYQAQAYGQPPAQTPAQTSAHTSAHTHTQSSHGHAFQAHPYGHNPGAYAAQSHEEAYGAYGEAYGVQVGGQGAEEDYESYFDAGVEPSQAEPDARGWSVAMLSQVTGALVSTGLIIGVTLWSYQLIMRDVSGVPIVRATEGPMRVAPEIPGGSQAAHQGLSVNEVAGRGAAGGPAPELRLAPAPVDLSAEDQSRAAFRVTEAAAATGLAPKRQPSANQSQTGASQTASGQAQVQMAALGAVVGGREAPSLQDTAIQALADQIAETALRNAPQTPDATETPPAAQANVPGGRSLRPQTRPSGLTMAALRSAPAPVASVVDVDAASLPDGTRLVQLGAYDGQAVAEREWLRISGRFDTFFEGKRRVIQRATSGGRVFYRLRAEGFEDLADARRFCAALVAERADCIPVVTR